MKKHLFSMNIYRDPHPVELYNQFSYEIDLLIWVLGSLLIGLSLISFDLPASIRALCILLAVVSISLIGTKRVENENYVNTPSMSRKEYIALMESKGFHFSKEAKENA